MEIINRAALTAEQLAVITNELADAGLLMEVYGCYRRAARAPVPEVIKQDEYSLDVIFHWRADLWLVCGTT